MSFFEKLKMGLAKTRKGITEKIDQLLVSLGKIDEDLFDELEEILISSDIGVDTALLLTDRIRLKVRENKISDASRIKELLKDELLEIFGKEESRLNIEPSPAIIMITGVNGTGKTTSAGKLAGLLKKEGKKVMLAAADTFRAAAIEQLQVWADRAGVELIKQNPGSDPAAVVFDAIQAARARKVDVLICDTAGRLHTKKNLMEELGKVSRIIDREIPRAVRENLLVLDATTGQNAIAQARTFNEIADITGIVLTKLDGTAKGGIVIAIKSVLDIPVKLIGVGEQADDLQPFDPVDFVEALL